MHSQCFIAELSLELPKGLHHWNNKVKVYYPPLPQAPDLDLHLLADLQGGSQQSPVQWFLTDPSTAVC